MRRIIYASKEEGAIQDRKSYRDTHTYTLRNGDWKP